MVVDDLHFRRAGVSVLPLEADSPLVVDAYAPLPPAIALQSFQPVAWPREVAQPHRRVELVELARRGPDTCDLAASYAAGIIRNHPFVDGNKRTGFMSAYLFMAENGLQLTVPEVEVVQIVTLLAASEIDEAAFASWLREHGKPI